MAPPKKIPDLSDKAGADTYLEPRQIAEAISPASLSDSLLAVFLKEMNVEVDELAHDIAAIRAVKATRKSNPKTKYDVDISKAGEELVQRIENAPAIVSRYFRFTNLVEQLRCIDEWLDDARADPALEGLVRRDPYRMTEPGRRHAFIADAHSIYKRYTGRKDWANKNHSFDPEAPESNRCSNPFFRLIRICLTEKALGRPIGQSTIEKDISAAKKLASTQKNRK